MYSNPVIHQRNSGEKAIIAIVFALFGCGRVQDTSNNPMPSPTLTVPSGETTYVVENNMAGIGGSDIALFSLNFSSTHRSFLQGTNLYPDEQFHQIDPLHALSSGHKPCTEGEQDAYVATMGDLHPVDSGYVGSMRIDLRNEVAAPEDRYALCFAVHTKSSGWQWHLAPIRIIIDFGSQDFGGGPGGGHIDLAINTADVDLVALMPSVGGPATLSKITYTAIPAAH